MCRLLALSLVNAGCNRWQCNEIRTHIIKKISFKLCYLKLLGRSEDNEVIKETQYATFFSLSLTIIYCSYSAIFISFRYNGDKLPFPPSIIISQTPGTPWSPRGIKRTHLVGGWRTMQPGRVVGRERIFVILAEIDGRVADAANEDEACHDLDDLLDGLEIALVRKTLHMHYNMGAGKKDRD